MIVISKETKDKVEKYPKENKRACRVVWRDNFFTNVNANGYVVENIMINVQDDNVPFYTPLSDSSVIINVI